MDKEEFTDFDELYPTLSKQYYWEYDESDDPFDYYYFIQTPTCDYYITSDGMTVYKTDERVFVTTNVVPRALFPHNPFVLKESHLFQLLNIPVEGRVFTLQEMDERYEQYLREQLSE